MTSVRWKVASGIAALLSAGCFSYVVVDAPGVPLRPGTELRLTLRQPDRFQLTDVAVENVSTVQGEFVEWVADSLVISVLWLASASGMEHKGKGESAVVAGSHIQRLERKAVSGVKTAGLIGVTVLGSALLNVGLTGGVFGSSGGTKPPPTR